MYTIVMDKYKNLNTTVKATIFQKESLVDKIQFLIPPQYEGIDVGQYVALLKYVDPNGNFHTEKLEADEEMYKDYLRYVLPVDTKLTTASGTVVVRLTFIDANGEETEEINKLETNSTTIKIEKPNGFNDFVVFEDIEASEINFIEFN